MPARATRLLVVLFALVAAIPSFGQWLPRRPQPRGPLTLNPRILGAVGQPGPGPIVKPPDKLLIKFRPAKTVAGRGKMQQMISTRLLPGMSFHREINHLGIQVYRVARPGDLQAALTRVRQMPEVLYAEPSQKIKLHVGPPNDFYYSRIDQDVNHVLFYEAGWPYQWALQFIEAEAAWNVWPNTYYTAGTKPLNAVKVAVIDTGIDLDHPDFKNMGGTSTDILAGGQLDLTNARNFFNGGVNADPLNPWDDFGHGTHVAGIVGAATNNGIGVASLGYPNQILPLKVTDASGDGDDVDVIDAMLWAVDHGSLVINMSVSLNGGYSQGLQDAVNYAWDHNVLVVAAAGNDGTDFVRRYPAACNKVLAVGSTIYANDDSIPPYETQASYSTFGLYIGIAAPGGDATYFLEPNFGLLIAEIYTLIWSTTPTYPTPLSEGGITESSYGYLNGTSMASPHVAALAGLYAGKKGYTQATAGAPRLMVRAIQRGADNIAGREDGGWTLFLGQGRINAHNTLSEVIGLGRDSSTPGCITGQVTYFGTPVMNAAITAVRSGSPRQYPASSKEDGTYRIANVPAGSYTVTTKYFGLTKQKVITVESACDTLATDFEMDASGIAVTVTPHFATVKLGNSFQFNANVTGAGNPGALWSITNGPGSIDSSGLYTAPSTATLPATVEIQAASVVDPTKFDTAQITIVADTSIAVQNLVGRNGSPIELKGTLTRVPDGAGVANKILSFKVNGVSAGTAVTASNGLASLVYTLPVGIGSGDKPIEITFGGDAAYNSSLGTGTISVNPVPVITSISPKTAARFGPAFTLTVNGDKFLSDSVVQWNGSARPTTYVNSQKLTAAIPASDLTTPGGKGISVFTPGPGGGLSNTHVFTVGVPALSVTASFARVGAEIVATVTIKNGGNATASNVKLTSSTMENLTLGGVAVATTTALPISLGTLTTGSQATTTVRFPGTLGTVGQLGRLNVLFMHDTGSLTGSVPKSLP